MAKIFDRMRKLKEQATKALRSCVEVAIGVAEKVVEIAEKAITWVGKKIDQLKAVITEVKASEKTAEDGVEALHAVHAVESVGVKAAAHKVIEKYVPHDFLANLGLHAKTWALNLGSLAQAHHATWLANLCGLCSSATPFILGVSVASWALTAVVVGGIVYYRNRKNSRLAQEASELHKKINDLTEKIEGLKSMLSGIGEPFAAAA